MTILEVLFAIMITAVGLLGAISVFPVASEYARKGRLNDQVAVSGESAAHDFDARGMRRPTRWISYVDRSPANPATAHRGDTLAATFPATYWRTAFCIDPRFTSANATAHADNEQNWTYFPAYPTAAPRMQRVTLCAGPIGLPAMSRFQADDVFAIKDSLVYERHKVGTTTAPDDVSQLLSPIKDANGTYPGKREEEGKLSWMATLVPKIDRNTSLPNGNGVPSDLYTLSIVIFDKRSPQMVTRDFNVPTTAYVADNEWTVGIASGDFYSGGFGGGEVRLNADYEEKLKLHSGDWVMIHGMSSGPKDTNGNQLPPGPSPQFRWYRVTDGADVDTAMIGGVSRFVKEVTLVGPDFDLADLNNDGQPDAVEVTVMPGIVGVFERTVRLEVDGVDVP
jgi:type II secretory pathway pseudopilin PulG